MKPSYALNLSTEGIGLLHRSAGGWQFVGQVSLDDPGLAQELAFMRRTAAELEPGGITTKLVIPNSQVLYRTIEVESTSDQDRTDAVRAAMDGATPYALDQLAIDWQPAGEGRVAIAAVARQTLREAETFAEDNRFNPVSFVACPDSAADFPGEPFFGETRAAASLLDPGTRVERERVPVPMRLAAAPIEAAPDEPADEAGPATDAEPKEPPRPVVARDPESDAKLVYSHTAAPEPELAPPPAPEPVVLRDAARAIPVQPAPERRAGRGPRPRRKLLSALEQAEAMPPRSQVILGLILIVLAIVLWVMVVKRETVTSWLWPSDGVPTPASQIAAAPLPPVEAGPGTAAEDTGGTLAARTADVRNLSAGDAAKAAARALPLARAAQPTGPEILAAAPADVSPAGRPKAILTRVSLTTEIPPAEAVALTGRPHTPKIDAGRLMVASGAGTTIPPAPVGAPAPRVAEKTTARATGAATVAVRGSDLSKAPTPSPTGARVALAGIAAGARPTRAPGPQAATQVAALARLATSPAERLVGTEVPPSAQDGAAAPGAETGQPPAGQNAVAGPQQIAAVAPGDQQPPNQVAPASDALPATITTPDTTFEPGTGANITPLRPPLVPGRTALLDTPADKLIAELRPPLRPEPPAPDAAAIADAVAAADANNPEAAADEGIASDVTALRPRERPPNVGNRNIFSATGRATVPPAPSTASVAREATDQGALRLQRVNLLGTFGNSAHRLALVRVSGKVVRVRVGDDLDGGRVSQITSTTLTYVKFGREHQIELPRG